MNDNSVQKRICAITCVHQKHQKKGRPDVDKCKQFGVFNVCRVFESLKKVIQNRHKLLTLFTLSSCKKQQQDPVFKNPDDLTLRVELILVPVVLHQNSVQEQVHHDEGMGWERCCETNGETKICAVIYVPQCKGVNVIVELYITLNFYATAGCH